MVVINLRSVPHPGKVVIVVLFPLHVFWWTFSHCRYEHRLQGSAVVIRAPYTPISAFPAILCLVLRLCSVANEPPTFK